MKRQAPCASAIIVSSHFDAIWPWAADYWHDRWLSEGPVLFRRLQEPVTQLADLVPDPSAISRLVLLQQDLGHGDLQAFTQLQELVWLPHVITGESTVEQWIRERGIRRYQHSSEGYWGQSVAEFALALTLCALRRIPQTHCRMQQDLQDWDYDTTGGRGMPGERGQQYGDDSRFTNGTLAGKKVRIVGAGNIGSRFAHFASSLGADVAIWDPFASEPCFHRAGARREVHLHRLLADAEIFAPMLPLRKETEGLITARHISALPASCLVVQVTRARICDTEALYRRVLADELALAADVFDKEPLALGHALLGRDNVVHTPHNAGRTRQANEAFVEALIHQFTPRVPVLDCAEGLRGGGGKQTALPVSSRK